MFSGSSSLLSSPARLSTMSRRARLLLLCATVVSVLTACGGSGGLSSVGTTTTAPAITAQPSSVTVATGGAATFTVVASGTSLAYQWYKGDSTATGTAISEATASSYAIASAASGDAGGYYVTITNSAGSVTSSVATLTVTASPAIVGK